VVDRVLKHLARPWDWLAEPLVLLRQCLSVRPDLRATLSQLEHFGYRSIGIVATAGLAVGGIVAVHTGGYVRDYSAGDLAGWAVGYATLREIGPLLTGLLLAGRVGAMNAAELADMKARDQILGLEALGLNPIPLVIGPRVWAAFCAGILLYSLAAICALTTAVVGVSLSGGLNLQPFLISLHTGTPVAYLLIGQFKAGVFALVVALWSTKEGLKASAGGAEVGRAVNNAAVGSAVGIVVANFVLTLVLP